MLCVPGCKVLLDTCRLFLSDHPLSVEPLHSGIQAQSLHSLLTADWCLNCADSCTTQGAVCVAEAGPLDLLLTVRSEESADHRALRSTDHKGLGLEVEFSGGKCI